MSPDKKNYLVWALTGFSGLILISLIFLIIFIFNLLVSSARNINFSFVSPPPPPKAEEFVAPPPKISPYATDSGILKLRSDLQKLRADIDSIDIFEPQLSPPNIDLNINIKSQWFRS